MYKWKKRKNTLPFLQPGLYLQKKKKNMNRMFQNELSICIDILGNYLL